MRVEGWIHLGTVMTDTTGSRLVGFYREISNTDVRHIATEPLRPAVQLHKRRIACICCKSLRWWSSARLNVTYLKLSVKHPQVSGSSSLLNFSWSVLWICMCDYEYVCVIRSDLHRHYHYQQRCQRLADGNTRNQQHRRADRQQTAVVHCELPAI